MLTIRDLSGNEEHLTDFKELTLNRKVNGEKQLSLTLLPTPHNEHSFPMVEEESVLTFDNEEYVIKKMTERGIGNTTVKRVEAIHKFYVDMINKQQPNIHNGSITFANFLSFVFNGTGYTFTIIDSFLAQSFENLGNDNRLALLQKGLERYKAEMEIVGSDVRFKKQVGNDTDFQFRYGHNIKSIEKDVDSTNLATVIRGTGAEGITAYYRSPNADILGEIDSPPVNDERFKSQSALLTEMKARLQDTPEFSITIDFVDLRAAGYPWTIPNEGDRVYVIYEPMNDLLIENRILEIKEVYNAKFQVIKTEVTLANYKKSFAGTMFDNLNKRLKDIVNDDGVIKYNVLDEAVKIATEALKSAQTELEFNNGIIARDKDNPNLLVLFNSMGVGISTDGGNTFRQAITPQGIVTDLLTAGQINANNIAVRGGGENDYSLMDANGFYAKGTAFTVERPDGYASVNNGIIQHGFNIQGAYPPFQTNGVEQVGRWCRVQTTNRYENIQQFAFKHESRYVVARVGLYAHNQIIANMSFDLDTTPEGTGETSRNLGTISVENLNTTRTYEITLDLGVPTGDLKIIYVRLYGNSDSYYTFGRILYLRQEG